jgi:TolA-binding protein
MNWKVLVGIMLVIMGVGLFVYYDRYVRPEQEARELLAEAKLIFERGDESGDRESLNLAINRLEQLIARYPKTKSVHEAYFYTGRCLERLNSYRTAYLRYSTLMRGYQSVMAPELREEVLVRLARINVLKQYSEEGVHQLYSILNSSNNPELRGRIYTELGYTYLNQGKYRNALRMFDISRQQNGGNEEAILGQARAYKRMGQDMAAYNMYDHFLRYYGAISPYSRDVRRAYREQTYWSGLREYRRGHYDSALGYFGRILRNFPHDSKSEYALYWSGESYFAQKNFNRAINYFDRVLSNGHYIKDQDARIKKGYAYFMSKRFDLAAREFQAYLRDYPRGKYSDIAHEWRGMSTKELLYRIESQKIPEAPESVAPRVEEKVRPDPRRHAEEDLMDEENFGEPKKAPAPSRKVEEDEEVSGHFTREGRRIDLDIVTEL